MKFIIIGSGGCVCLPKPLYQCRICVEARKKDLAGGIPSYWATRAVKLPLGWEDKIYG